MDQKEYLIIKNLLKKKKTQILKLTSFFTDTTYFNWYLLWVARYGVIWVC